VSSFGPLTLLVLQPTPFCNLDCDYCYLPSRSDTSRMPLDLMDLVGKRLQESDLLRDSFTLVWHAGEPLVLPVTFYREAMSRLSARLPKGTRVRHAFQTNATLIDDAWCEFFGEPGVTVGVSIDGPQPIHDAHRRSRSGRGSFRDGMAGVERLQAHGIPFYCISVLTAESLEFPDELFDFYLDQGIGKVAFNIEELEGTNRSSSLSADGSVERFKRFLRRFIRLCAGEGWPIEIREIEQLLASLGHGDQPVDNQQVRPFEIVSIDWEGNVSTHSPELVGFGSPRFPSFVLGNLRGHSFAEMARGPVLSAIQAEIDAGVALCRDECPYFPVCGGGVPANKLFENGSFATSETLYCRLMRKAVVDVALECRDCFANRPACRPSGQHEEGAS
jgi:uncharacterized protein